MEDVKKSDLIDIVTLSKFVAGYKSMTTTEACDWITKVAIRNSISVYDISYETLPELIPETRSGDYICEVFNQNWWRNPELENSSIPILRIATNKVAILISDASVLLKIPAEFFPRILNTETKLKPIHQDKPTMPDEHISDNLAALNRAAFEFWSSADPEDKLTHPTNEQVMTWLKKQGFSDINAKQGAVIIRPEWAATGRPPKK